MTVPVSRQVSISGEWSPWQAKVPQIEVETHKVAAPDVVVPTLDTVRHEALLYTWLAEHKPLVLCGPPGSGKTMTLFSALRALPDMEVPRPGGGGGRCGGAGPAVPDGLCPREGRGSELLECHDARAAAEDLRPLLRVQAHAQRGRPGSRSARKVAGAVL